MVKVKFEPFWIGFMVVGPTQTQRPRLDLNKKVITRGKEYHRMIGHIYPIGPKSA